MIICDHFGEKKRKTSFHLALLIETYTRLKWLRVHNDMIMMVVNIDNLIIICDHSWKTQNFFSSCHPLWSCLGLITSKLLFEIFFEKNKTLITLLLGTAIRVHMGCHQGSGRKKHYSVKTSVQTVVAIVRKVWINSSLMSGVMDILWSSTLLKVRFSFMSPLSNIIFGVKQ